MGHFVCPCHWSQALAAIPGNTRSVSITSIREYKYSWQSSCDYIIYIEHNKHTWFSSLVSEHLGTSAALSSVWTMPVYTAIPSTLTGYRLLQGVTFLTAQPQAAAWFLHYHDKSIVKIVSQQGPIISYYIISGLTKSLIF